MEIMEEGNMMDRVRILLQRDLGYYQAHQTVLQENLCPGVVGGLLDFPHYASFAAVKLVLWWEEEYVAAFRRPSGLLETGGEIHDNAEARGCGGVAKTSAPAQLVATVTHSACQLLEHLHTLSQEALDHADLTVLTGTLGAAALIKNCLWCYNEQLKADADKADDISSLHGSYKQFHEMAEALAERLLDLHCRLLSLYILQDSDCLHWEDPRPFFEGERGSFVIQMWWLYMKGTREDLWNTVPPKMAQRILAGMLNESLTILTARYTQAVPSPQRAALLVVDLSNLLLCVAELLPSICCQAEELVGLAPANKVLRDVHAKCHELLCVLVLRGCPLATLYRVFRRGLAGLPLLGGPPPLPAPWLVLTAPHLFPPPPLPDGPAIAVELSVLAAQPQASWPLLLKVLMMRDCTVACLITQQLKDHLHQSEATQEAGGAGPCGAFLCAGGGDCLLGPSSSQDGHLSAGATLQAVVHTVVQVGRPADVARVLLPALELQPSWGGCLDRRHVWNQSQPPWLRALLSPLDPLAAPVVHILLISLQETEPPVDFHSAVGLAVDALSQLTDCLPPTLLRAVAVLEEALPADVHPLGGSVLLQMLVATLYSQLVSAGPGAPTALAEALCDMDEHTPHLQHFLQSVTTRCEWHSSELEPGVEFGPHVAEVAVSSLLLTQPGRRSLKILWQFLQHCSEWVLGQLGAVGPGQKLAKLPVVPANSTRPAPAKLLHTMFHTGHRHFDQLLAGTWALDWQALLCEPLSLTQPRLWAQLSRRHEFREPPHNLSQHDATVVAALCTLLEPNAQQKTQILE